MKHRFSLSDTVTGCKEGRNQALKLFKGDRSYSFSEIISSGAKPEYICWLIFQRADDDPVLLDMIRAGTMSSLKKAGLEAANLTTISKCQKEMMRVVKEDMKKSGKTKKDALSVACSEVLRSVNLE